MLSLPRPTTFQSPASNYRISLSVSLLLAAGIMPQANAQVADTQMVDFQADEAAWNASTLESEGLQTKEEAIQLTAQFTPTAENRYGTSAAAAPQHLPPVTTKPASRYGTAASQPFATPTQTPALLSFPTTAKTAPIKPIPSRSIKPAPVKSEFQTRLTALELAISTVVSERPNLWRFETLEAEATELLLLSKTEADRHSVREIAERLEHFSKLSQRFRDTRQSSPTQLANRQPATQQASRTNTVASATARKNSPYDATGVLRPVVSKRPNAPKFALVDEQGRITSFVTPTASIDLEPLLGKRLGIKGSRGFIPEYQREHVTADRVATLDQLVR